MPNAVLTEGVLADDLVDVVDDIRREVHGALGTRPWAVAIVKRTWGGGRRGVGHATEQVVVLDPAPQVRRVTKDRMGPAGREAAGNVVLTGVSLRYTLRELAPEVDPGVEYAYRLTDLHGQGMPPRWFVLSADPVPRRGDKYGDSTDWYVLLNETSDMGDLDGVNG